MSEIVSKNGEGGSKKDKSFEAMQKRANKAIEGAKRYRTNLNEKLKEEAERQLMMSDMGMPRHNQSTMRTSTEESLDYY